MPVSADVLVSVGDGENIDNAVKRFKREVSAVKRGALRCRPFCSVHPVVTHPSIHPSTHPPTSSR